MDSMPAIYNLFKNGETIVWVNTERNKYIDL